MSETVIITGASQGIGKEIWQLFAQYDYHAVGVARNSERLETIHSELINSGFDSDFASVDLSDLDSVDSYCEQLLAKEPELHGVIFNAGYAASSMFKSSSDAERQREFQVNYHSTLRMLDHLLPYCVEQGFGRFIAMGSLSMVTSFPGNANYAASKAALACLWRTLSHEYAQHGLQFGLVLPGLTATDMSEHMPAKFPRRSAHSVARLTWDVYHAPRLEQTLGIENRIAQWANRLAPRAMDAVIRRFSHLLTSQDY